MKPSSVWIASAGLALAALGASSDARAGCYSPAPGITSCNSCNQTTTFTGKTASAPDIGLFCNISTGTLTYSCADVGMVPWDTQAWGPVPASDKRLVSVNHNVGSVGQACSDVYVDFYWNAHCEPSSGRCVVDAPPATGGGSTGPGTGGGGSGGGTVGGIPRPPYFPNFDTCASVCSALYGMSGSEEQLRCFSTCTANVPPLPDACEFGWEWCEQQFGKNSFGGSSESITACHLRVTALCGYPT